MIHNDGKETVLLTISAMTVIGLALPAVAVAARKQHVTGKLSDGHTRLCIPDSTVLDDFNGDGQTDYRCRRSDGTDMIAFSQGDGTFVSPLDNVWCNVRGIQTGEANSDANNNVVGTFRRGDFNGDGQTDYQCQANTGENWVAIANDDDSFRTVEGFRFCRNKVGTNTFRFGDFNGDGATDYHCHTQAGANWVALSNGDGSFAAKESGYRMKGSTSAYQSQAWCNTSGSHTFSLGDFDGDGTTDYHCHTQEGKNIIAFSQGDGMFETQAGTFVIDSDGDRLTDIDEVQIYDTNPNEPDSDGDGLSDFDEVKIHKFDPNNSDSDGDGLTDAEEVPNPNSDECFLPRTMMVWDTSDINSSRERKELVLFSVRNGINGVAIDIPNWDSEVIEWLTPLLDALADNQIRTQWVMGFRRNPKNKTFEQGLADAMTSFEGFVDFQKQQQHLGKTGFSDGLRIHILPHQYGWISSKRLQMLHSAIVDVRNALATQLPNNIPQVILDMVPYKGLKDDVQEALLPLYESADAVSLLTLREQFSGPLGIGPSTELVRNHVGRVAVTLNFSEGGGYRMHRFASFRNNSFQWFQDQYQKTITELSRSSSLSGLVYHNYSALRKYVSSKVIAAGYKAEWQHLQCAPLTAAPLASKQIETDGFESVVFNVEGPVVTWL